MSQVWTVPGEATLTVATKGAPEAIAALCHFDDAPALKAAHIGIAMGKRGTDVAR